MGCLLELGLVHSRALRHLSGCLPFSLSLSLVSFVFYIVYLSVHCRYIVQLYLSLSLSLKVFKTKYYTQVDIFRVSSYLLLFSNILFFQHPFKFFLFCLHVKPGGGPPTPPLSSPISVFISFFLFCFIHYVSICSSF